jgi:Polysaccharide pyruvyl transferase
MKLLYFFLILFTALVHSEEQFGYISYTSKNLGDDFQSIAALRFLPKNSLPVDRDTISKFNHSTTVHTLVNGWFMHRKPDLFDVIYLWPPAQCIDPFFISVHFTKGFLPKALSEKSVDYLMQHCPIGVRDPFTLNELQKKGIPCYFSGCLTLTLDNPFTERENIIYAVDVKKEVVKYIKAHTDAKVVEVTHHYSKLPHMRPEERLEFAQALLEKYQKAKCVVTSRLHATLPCLAFETPVLLLNTQRDQYRFSGLNDLAHNCSQEELLAGKSGFNFTSPPQNPPDYLPLRENLINIVTNWVQSVNLNH